VYATVPETIRPAGTLDAYRWIQGETDAAAN